MNRKHQASAVFSSSRLATFQRRSGLSCKQIARVVRIRQRSLTRRQSGRELSSDELGRLQRISALFDRAVELFGGDRTAARTWLLTPQVGLGGKVPLVYASSENGAREVEDLIGRLEYGVIT